MIQSGNNVLLLSLSDSVKKLVWSSALGSEIVKKIGEFFLEKEKKTFLRQEL